MSAPSPPRPLAKAVMVGRTASDNSSHLARPVTNSTQKELKDRHDSDPKASRFALHSATGKLR